MTLLFLTCTLYLLLPCCVPFTHSSELQFYRDSVPEAAAAAAADIALGELARYLELEAEEQQERNKQHAHFHHFILNHQNEEDSVSGTLAAEAKLANILRKGRLDNWNYPREAEDFESIADAARRRNERLYNIPYYNRRDPLEKIAAAGLEDEYSFPKFSYFPSTGMQQNPPELTPLSEGMNPGYRIRASAPNPHHYQFQKPIGHQVIRQLYSIHLEPYQEGSNQSPPPPPSPAPAPPSPPSPPPAPARDAKMIAGLPLEPAPEPAAEPPLKSPLDSTPESGSEFTFHFDDSNLGEKHPFAVKPNDPRYYRDSAFFSSAAAEALDHSSRADDEAAGGYRRIAGIDDRDNDEAEPNGEETHSTDKLSRGSPGDGIPAREHAKASLENNEISPGRNPEEIIEKTEASQFKDISILALNDLNNDIYFIAIVAGCSAAAMFTLVLISLTWCRLQRGVKAAADIEYPAYGVTGPNKDVSPSGDQRLAHTAQMYHFQQQKQQIIAMENRISTARDPGSVSEAESDEENDEGDHTVYECPGLASTGELEVKNPLFHDDSTPATPAKSLKDQEEI